MKTANHPHPDLRARLRRLGLYGLLACCDDIAAKPSLDELLSVEEAERQRRSLDRRLRAARIGTFKGIADFDWTWPRRVDRQAIEEIFGRLGFLDDGTNVILLGSNGLGKTMPLPNLAHKTVVRGHTVRVTTAATCSPTSLPKKARPRRRAGFAATHCRICSASTRSDPW